MNRSDKRTDDLKFFIWILHVLHCFMLGSRRYQLCIILDSFTADMNLCLCWACLLNKAVSTISSKSLPLIIPLITVAVVTGVIHHDLGYLDACSCKHISIHNVNCCINSTIQESNLSSLQLSMNRSMNTLLCVCVFFLKKLLYSTRYNFKIIY